MPIRLIIELDDTGHVSASGPMSNKVLCYGMLEVARDIIAKHQAGETRLVAPAGVRFQPPKPQG